MSLTGSHWHCRRSQLEGCLRVRHRCLSYRTFPRLESRARPTVLFFCAMGICASAYLFFPRTSRSAPTNPLEPISCSHFNPAVITSSEPSGPNTKLITLSVPPHLLPSPSSPVLTSIWSVFIKDDDIQVERPYTPLEGADDRGHMTFWIKKYRDGEVGRWLHSKNVGDIVELRGPMKTWNWQEDVWDDVIMISGGTGITPFYQLFNSIIADNPSPKSPRTKFTLLHSSRSPAELPPTAILQPLMSCAARNPDLFKLQLFVDVLDGSENSTNPEYNLRVGQIGKAAIEDSLGLHHHQKSRSLFTPPVNRKIMFLICGPNQMINAISGPFGRDFSQGVVGGVLGEMGYTSSEVWKL